jgi:hypothetical protein
MFLEEVVLSLGLVPLPLGQRDEVRPRHAEDLLEGLVAQILLCDSLGCGGS